MIISVRIKGYKILRDVEIKPAKLTVLVGPNGCGKSSVLEAIEGAVRALVEEKGLYLPAAASRPDVGRLTVELRHSVYTGRLVLDYQSKEILGKPWSLVDDAAPPMGRAMRQEMRRSHLWPITRLRFSHEHLVAPTPAATGTPALTPEGDGLATLVNHLAARRDRMELLRLYGEHAERIAQIMERTPLEQRADQIADLSGPGSRFSALVRAVLAR